LKCRTRELLEQQRESEMAFAQQRAKFMELFKQKEGRQLFSFVLFSFSVGKYYVGPVGWFWVRVSISVGDGRTTVLVLHDAQLLLNKQQQICVGVFIH